MARKYIDSLDKTMRKIEAKIDGMETRIEDKINIKLEQFRDEIRNMDNQRNADMREIRESLSSATKHIQNMSIAVTVGVAAIALTAVGFGWSILISAK